MVYALLVLATLLLGFVVFVSYPTLPSLTPWQAAFDIALLAALAGLACAWRLAVLHTRRGRPGLAVVHPGCFVASALGALVGIFAATVALWHWQSPETANELVGFAMLLPAVLLAPVALILYRARGKARPPASAGPAGSARRPL